MTLSTGTKLSHYEITSQIGKGGMGEVYQATDTKLGRSVAIKVLPEEFAKDADRAARFQREAKLLASLNHPNIAAIYGLEEADGTHFLVLELVEGQTLAERIQTGPIDVEEALKLGLQIAEALEAAHERGVIHRDLKPANIKVTPDGKVKVLDFGLAKAYAGEQDQVILSNSPTLSDMTTQQGLILGTAAYMSPEQARGKPLDKRTDVWAFGCVLYEMLTGQAAFQGEDVTEILAAVVKSSVNLDLLPANLHPRISEVLCRCLQKDQKKRYAGVGDAHYEIEKALSDPRGLFVQPVTIAKPRKNLRFGLPWVVAGFVLGLIIGGVTVWKLQSPPPGNIVRFTHLLGEEHFTYPGHPIIDISRDGTQLAYVADGQIWLLNLSDFEAKPVVETDKGPSTPFFSPDGENIGFWSSDGKLKRVPVAGGTSIEIAKADNPHGARWCEDNSIVYGAAEGVWRVSGDGGKPERIVESREGEQVFGPQILPGGTHILYSVSKGTAWDEAEIVVESLETHERQTIWTGGNDAHYLPTGHLIYAFENDLFALRFNLQTLSTEGGRPARMIEGLERGGSFTGTAQYAISDGGTLVYAQGTGSVSFGQSVLAFVDREGTREDLTAPPRNYTFVRLSPNGEKIAVEVLAEDGSSDIWIWSIPKRNLSQLTHEGGARWPLWTPDGEEITYSSEGSLWNIRSDFTGAKTQLEGTDMSQTVVPASWSPDGQVLLFIAAGSGIHSWTRKGGASGQTGSVDLVVPNPEDGSVYNPTFSPDGKWFIFSSVEGSSEPQLYAYPFPVAGTSPLTVTTDGGYCPVWPREREEIIFLAKTSMYASEVRTEPRLTRDNPVKLFPIESPGFRILTHDVPRFDVSRDGEKLLFSVLKGVAKTDSGEAESQPGINIILNWFEELKEKVPVD